MRWTARHVNLLTLLLAIVLLVGGIYADRMARESAIARAKAQAQQDLARLRAQLEAKLSGDLQLVRGLLAVIASAPDLDQPAFERAAAPLFAGRTQLRNIAMAPDMVIRLMYPMAGNEKAVGLDYRAVPAQFATADLARQKREIVVAGPITLVQGGTGIIARLPVYLDRPEGEVFWGIVSAVIDADKLYAAAGLTDPALPVQLAIRGRNAQGPEGEVFFGDAATFAAQPVVADIPLPWGRWQMAALPHGGWAAAAPPPWGQRVGWVVMSALILGAMIALGRSLRAQSKAWARAEAASAAKGRFLATMSHEVRTPLNGILGMAQVLRMPGHTEAEVREYAQVILDSGNNLLRLLNDVLDYSRLEAGNIALHQEAFSPLALLREADRLYGELARGKGLAFTVSSELDERRHVLGDAVRLRQMIGNLTSNAIRFTAQGEVALSVAWCGPDQLEFAVRDTGIGIPADKQAEIFEAFTQADASTTREYGGTGLGLSIVRELARLHGGEAGVDSAPGQGSRFWFRVRVGQVEQS